MRSTPTFNSAPDGLGAGAGVAVGGGLAGVLGGAVGGVGFGLEAVDLGLCLGDVLLIEG